MMPRIMANKSTVRSPSNIAFIKYWGAEDLARAIPANPSLSMTLREDAHLIVVAWGERHDLKTGYGKSWQSGMHPCAFTNPFWIDVDGHGWRANGDTLGQPLPLAS